MTSYSLQAYPHCCHRSLFCTSVFYSPHNLQKTTSTELLKHYVMLVLPYQCLLITLVNRMLDTYLPPHLKDRVSWQAFYSCIVDSSNMPLLCIFGFLPALSTVAVLESLCHLKWDNIKTNFRNVLGLLSRAPTKVLNFMTSESTPMSTGLHYLVYCSDYLDPKLSESTSVLLCQLQLVHGSQDLLLLCHLISPTQ